MTYTLIPLALFCAYLLWQLRQANLQLERERHAHRDERQDLTTQIERGYRFARDERRELYQRLQAPEIAVAQHQAEGVEPGPKHLPFDDDRAFEEFVTGGFRPEGLE